MKKRTDEGIDLHKDLIDKNFALWQRKSLLRTVYIDLYSTIKKYLGHVDGKIVELGSGMGSISEVMPECIRTDLFPYPWIDQVENAYELSFETSSLSNLIMIDVFHHLRYPGNALQEFLRVLKVGGRVIIMEPGLSVLGNIIYGFLHAEPIGKASEIQWFASADWSSSDMDYYAAQGNATHIFLEKQFGEYLRDWRIVEVSRIVALAYAASGGYSGPQLYPSFSYPFIKFTEKILQLFPALFATRLLVVIEKKG